MNEGLPVPSRDGLWRDRWIPPAIIDGDTIRLGSEVIRLSNIDAPEMGWRAECDAERFLAEASKDRMEAILAATGEELKIDREGTDFYGRPLARIRVSGADEGELIAARRADALQDQGDVEGFHVWLAIEKTVKNWRRDKPSTSEPLN